MLSPTVSVHHIRKEPVSTHPVDSILIRNFVSWQKKIYNLQFIDNRKYWSSDGIEIVHDYGIIATHRLE